MAVLTYKALHGGSPRYLSALVHVANVSGRPALRSAGSNRLRISPFKLSTIGGRAFPVAAAQFWNRLARQFVVVGYPAKTEAHAVPAGVQLTGGQGGHDPPLFRLGDII